MAEHGHTRQLTLWATKEQRAALMVEMRREGQKLQEIADAFGLTRERVRQILRTSGGPTTQQVRDQRAAAQADRDRRHASVVADAVAEAVARRGPMTDDEASVETGLPSADVRAHWPDALLHMRIRTTDWTPQEWSTEAIMGALRLAATYEFPLTANAYHELVRIGEISGPSLPRVSQRFGSWAAACIAAGVEHGMARRTYQSRWTDEDLLSYVRNYFLDPNVNPTAAGYDIWKKQHLPDGPSAMTLRNRLGTWANIKRTALRSER